MVSRWGYEIPALFLCWLTKTFCPARTTTVDSRAAPTYSKLDCGMVSVTEVARAAWPIVLPTLGVL